MELVSWNVCGINACVRKGLVQFMKKQNADVYCFQEVKATEDNFPEELKTLRYKAFHSISSMRKGYSGVSIYTRVEPISVQKMGVEKFDNEGRVLVLEFDRFFLANVYFPNSNRELTRLPFKLDFNRQFLGFCKELERQKPVVMTGDFNVAHKEIDIKNAKQNDGNAGFTREERQSFGDFLENGFIDTFREFYTDGDRYTWWAFFNNARERNIGWRIDYFLISKELRKNLKKSEILPDVHGSDHCPILLKLEL